MSTTEALATIYKTITVDVPVEKAFETYTRRIHDWWPRGSHSLFDERETIVFEERVGGRVYERSTGGEEGDWADVLVWEPPNRFVLRWRVNPNAEPTEVEVRFTPEKGGTRVDLEHRGWESPERRANYLTGWDVVLAGFTDASTSE